MLTFTHPLSTIFHPKLIFFSSYKTCVSQFPLQMPLAFQWWTWFSITLRLTHTPTDTYMQTHTIDAVSVKTYIHFFPHSEPIPENAQQRNSDHLNNNLRIINIYETLKLTSNPMLLIYMEDVHVLNFNPMNVIKLSYSSVC